MEQTLASYLVPNIFRKYDFRQIREFLFGDTYEVICIVYPDTQPERLSEIENILAEYARREKAIPSLLYRNFMQSGIVKDFNATILSILINSSDMPEISKEFYENDFIGGEPFEDLHRTITILHDSYSIRGRIASLLLPYKPIMPE